MGDFQDILKSSQIPFFLKESVSGKNVNFDHARLRNEYGLILKIAFFLNLGFTIFEFIGGLYVNSIAIVSDAVHDLGDSLSLGTSWYLDHKSKKDANEKFSYGY